MASRHNGPHSDELRAKAVQRRDAGLTIRQIAVELDLPLSTVGEWIREDRPTLAYASRKSYRITGVGQAKGELPSTYRITVPPHIGNVIPPETEFVPELTEDGILFRRVEQVCLDAELPAWVTGNGATS